MVVIIAMRQDWLATAVIVKNSARHAAPARQFISATVNKKD
jgi:hypothetical protein